MRARWSETRNRQEKFETTLKGRFDNTEAVSDRELIELHGRFDEADARLRMMNIKKEARGDGRDPDDIWQKSPLGKLSKFESEDKSPRKKS